MFGLILGVILHLHVYRGHGDAGVYEQFTPTSCVGYEWHGEPGWFGNTLGLTGGDCS